MSISQKFPSVRPSLNLNFARAKKLDSRITFTRGSTGTYVDRRGLIRTAAINEARFDHDPSSLTSLGLLIEESRTNILLQSTSPDNLVSPWGKGPNTTRIGTVTSPDGTSNAINYSGDGSGGNEFVIQTVNLSANTTYTVSVWAKLISGSVPTAGNIITASYNNGSGEVRANVPFNGNLTTEWKRFSVTYTNVTAVTGYGQFFVADQNNTSQIAIWGAQLEAGRHATSYIPTTSATVTRSADYASITGTNFSNWFNPVEGTTFISYDKYYQQTQFDIPLYPTLFSLNAWPTRITYNDFGGVFQGMNAVISASFQADLYGSSTRPTNTNLKFIGTYKESDFAAIGTERVLYTDTSGAVPTGLTYATIGNEGLGGSTLINGHIEKIAYYPKRLTNTQLRELTN